MGRGRAKAKQTKVARDLKYKHQSTDLDRLARELSVANSQGSGSDDDEYDEYADSEDEGDSQRGHYRGA